MVFSHRLSKNIKVSWVVFLFVLGCWVITTQFRWNPDPHHDGIVLTGAIAFIDGYLPNAEYFAQYGPLASVLQGAGLLIFGKSLFGLKLFTSALVILTGMLVSFRVYRMFGFLVASAVWAIWSLTGPMGLPWPSLITTFMIVFGLSISFQIRGAALSLKPESLIVAVQLLLVGALIRIHLLVIVGFIIVVLYYKRHFLPKHYFQKIVVISLFTVGFLVSTLAFFGILNSYVEQSILWAFKHYATPEITMTYLSGLLWFVLIPFASFLIWKVTKLGLRRKFLISFVLVNIFSLILIGSRISIERNSQSLYNPIFFLTEFFRRMLLSWNYLSVSGFIFLAGMMIFKQVKKNSEIPLPEALLIAIGTGTLAQLYPLFDPWHIWMISPIFLLIISLLVPRVSLEAGFRSTLLLTSAALTLVLSVQFSSNLLNQNFEFNSKLLRGMTSERTDSPNIDRTLIALEQLDSTETKIRFLCTDGLYAAASQHFMSEDFMYVDWGLGLSPVNESTRMIFVCNYTQEQIRVLSNQGWQLQFNISNGHLNYEGVILRNALFKRS